MFGTGLRLSVSQTVRVVEDRCRTLAYQYALWRSTEKASWLVRWEYSRERAPRDDDYVLGHVHVNADFSEAAPALPGLHVPTARVPLELVLWHLIAEWGVKPKREDWRRILEESMRGFEERRTDVGAGKADV
jgi:hypothetical protein